MAILPRSPYCLRSAWCHSSEWPSGAVNDPQIVNDPKITEWPNPTSVSWGPQPFSCSTLKPAKLSVLWGVWEYCWYKFGWMDDFSEEWPPCRFFVGGDILALAPCSNPALLVETAKYSREQVKASRRLEKYNLPKNKIFNWKIAERKKYADEKLCKIKFNREDEGRGGWKLGLL